MNNPVILCEWKKRVSCGICDNIRITHQVMMSGKTGQITIARNVQTKNEFSANWTKTCLFQNSLQSMKP